MHRKSAKQHMVFSIGGGARKMSCDAVSIGKDPILPKSPWKLTIAIIGLEISKANNALHFHPYVWKQ